MAAAGIGGGGPPGRLQTGTATETGHGLTEEGAPGAEPSTIDTGPGADEDMEKVKEAGWTNPDAAGSVGGS